MSKITDMLVKANGGESISAAWELQDCYVFIAEADEDEFDPMMYKLGKNDAVPIPLEMDSTEFEAITNNRAKRII